MKPHLHGWYVIRLVPKTKPFNRYDVLYWSKGRTIIAIADIGLPQLRKEISAMRQYGFRRHLQVPLLNVPLDSICAPLRISH